MIRFPESSPSYKSEFSSRLPRMPDAEDDNLNYPDCILSFQMRKGRSGI